MNITKNSGLAIIGVSIAVTLLCLPLYAIAEKLQQIERDTQKKLKPKVDKIKAVFKGDEQYMILSTYYRQNHYHPIYALRSSISLLIQIPFFIAAYSFLSKLESLQGVSFLFIKDLGMQDALIKVGNFHINFLPIAMTLINCIAGAIYTKGFPLKEKLQLYIMALVFLVLLYTSPSGLVLYWTMNNVFSLFKNIFYKLKNPLKSFYYFCIACVFLAIIYILCFDDHGIKIKTVVTVALLFIISIPLLLKITKPFFKNLLSDFNSNEKLKTGVFLLSCIGMALLSGLVIPTNTISSSVGEFCFIEDISSPLYFVKETFYQAIGLFIFWPCCFYFLFPKKIKTVISFSLFSVLIFASIDTFLFTNISTTMTNTFQLTYAKPPLKEIAFNLLILLFSFALICVVFKFNASKSKFQISSFLTIILSISFLSLSILNISTIKKEYKELSVINENNSQIDSITPVFHLSKTEKNVVVIMIDRALSGFIQPIFNECPELKDKFSGFTFYPNTTSFGRFTLLGSAALWGGYDYTPFEMNKRSSIPLVDKQNEALKLMPKLFGENNYNVYDADMPLANFSQISDMSIFDEMKNVTAYNLKGKYTKYWCDNNNYNFKDNTKAMIERNSLWFSIFKCVPSVFRYYVYKNGNYWSASLFDDQRKVFLDSYAVLDYLPELTTFDSTNNCCIFYNNETPHNEIFLEAPKYTLSPEADKLNKYIGYGTEKKKDVTSFETDNLYHTTAAAIHRLADYLDFLKQNDVYDNTRIIFVSDHGNVPNYKYDLNPPEYDNGEIRYKTNCTLMFKDFNNNNEFSISNKFMSNADVPYLATLNLIENPVNPYTNNPILSDELKLNGLKITSNNKHRITEHNTNTFKISDDEWFTVQNNIFENNNWSEGINE